MAFYGLLWPFMAFMATLFFGFVALWPRLALVLASARPEASLGLCLPKIQLKLS